MCQVFISYRRASSQDICARLQERIDRRIGAGFAFLDAVSLQAGDDFLQKLRQAIAECRVMLVVIAPDWVSVKVKSGGPKLFEPRDFLRQEIELALDRGRGIEVIPVLIHGASMPSEDDLPVSIRPLAEKHAATS